MARPISGIILSEKIPLKEWDPDGDSYVVFRRPTRRETEALAALFMNNPIEWHEDGRTVRQLTRTSVAVVDREEVKLCMVDCNVPDAKGNPIFKPGKSCRPAGGYLDERIEEKFYEAWGNLPDELAEEIARELRRWHPPFARMSDEFDQGEE